MTIQAWASRVRQALGPDHPVLRTLRPVYEVTLDVLTLGRGYRRTVNGLDTFHVHPRVRGLIPEEYEPEVYRYLRATVTSGGIVLNIGSHVGIYALMLGRRVGPAGRVFAFEPNPATRRLLRSHLRRNRLRDRVEVRAEAVAGAPGTMPFVATGIEGYSRLGVPHPEARNQHHRTMQIPVTSVAQFCLDRRVRPTLLVIDVEGFEGDVLAGASAVLKDPKAVIVVEMHPEVWPSGEADRVRALLASAGRRAESLTGAPDPFATHNVARLGMA